MSISATEISTLVQTHIQERAISPLWFYKEDALQEKEASISASGPLKCGFDFRHTAYTYVYIYLYIYICCRVKTWSNFCLFWVKTCPSFLIFLFCSFSKIFFFLQGEWDKTNKEKTTVAIFLVKTWSNYVAQHTCKFWLNLGPSLTQPFWQFLAIFLFKICRNHYLYSVFSKMHFFAYPQTWAHYLWTQLRKLKNNCPFFSGFVFFEVFVVSGFCLFSRGMRNQKETEIQNKQKRKQYHKTHKRKPLSLVTKKNSTKKTLQPHCLDCKQTTPEIK